MNWVKARFDCSIDQAWVLLSDRVRQDIEEWRKHSHSEAVKENKLSTPDTISISQGNGYVILSKTGSHILVKLGTGSEIRTEFKLVPTVNEKGECRWLRDGRELDFWQASREILEPLLF